MFIDEAGFQMRPAAATTWSKVGQTPMIKVRGSWKNVSAAGALVISPGPRRRVRQYFKLYEHTIKAPDCADYVRVLLAQVRGPIDLFWDSLPAHKSKLVREVLNRPRVRIHVLPTYAPELNPVEPMWSNAKTAKLRGVAADTLPELKTNASVVLTDISRDQHLLRSFVRATPLRIVGISS